MLVDVALLGVGGVGKAVLEQLSLPSLKSRFRVFLLANSRYQVVQPPDANAKDPFELLKSLPSSASAAPAVRDVHKWELQELVRELCKAALKGNILIIDCTSDQALAESYPILLRNGLHIATPNKKAFSGSVTLYDELLASQFPRGGFLYHESTVGAALPIIGALHDLVVTGDHITRIEGVFSGTLSYIFNLFSQPGTAGSSAPLFSSIVSQARDLGYTEPHPADDLDGSDVGRKLTILARRLGPAFPPLTKGFASVPTESLIPAACAGLQTGGEFVAALQAHDAAFEQRRAEAHSRGKVLRYVGAIDAAGGTLTCGLSEFDFAHPFAASLGGSDNIVSFATERYTRPLIVQGAGAGGALTASGVVADCVRIAERLGA